MGVDAVQFFELVGLFRGGAHSHATGNVIRFCVKVGLIWLALHRKMRGSPKVWQRPIESAVCRRGTRRLGCRPCRGCDENREAQRQGAAQAAYAQSGFIRGNSAPADSFL